MVKFLVKYSVYLMKFLVKFWANFENSKKCAIHFSVINAMTGEDLNTFINYVRMITDEVRLDQYMNWN